MIHVYAEIWFSQTLVDSFHLKDGTCNFRECFSQSNLQEGAYSAKWAFEIIEEMYAIPVHILFLII